MLRNPGRRSDAHCLKPRTPGVFAFILLTLAPVAVTFAQQIATTQPGGNSHALQLRTGSIQTDTLPDLRAPTAAFDPSARYVIQLDGPITPQRSAALRTAGARLSDFLPQFSYIARLDPAAGRAVAGLPFVRWIGRFDSAWKLDPALANRPAAAPGAPAQAAIRIIAWSFADIDPVEFKTALSTIGTPIGDPTRMGTHTLVSLDVAPNRLQALSNVAALQFAEEDAPFEARNDAASWVSQSNVPNMIPLWDHGLHGENQIGGIIDYTLRLTHCAFTDTNPIGPTHRKIVSWYGQMSPPEEHGNLTCGTFVGDWRSAGLNQCYAGMAFAAKVVFRNLHDVGPTNLYSSFVQDHADGARVHNNSFGASVTTYNTSCVAIDRFARENEDDLVVFAINEFSPGIANPENAKNCLAVAASGRAPNQDMHAYGGAGPTNDGRRRPEVLAPGDNTVSAYYLADCGTLARGGTSLACPVVSGFGVLIRQYFMEGFFPGGAANPPDGFTPSGALIKAILENSAVDLTGVAGYPSNPEGWGRILVDDALYFSGDSRRLWIQDKRNAIGLTTGQQDVYQVLNLSSAQRLKITLVFTDVEGVVNSTQPVVNDLNLQVTAPDGTIFNGNVFDTVAGQSVAGGAADPLNNVEQVHRSAPDPGVYTIRVIGAAVNGPAANPQQGYALVVTGDIAQPPIPVLYFDYPASLPTFVQPGQPTDLTVRIQSAASPLGPNPPSMLYRFSTSDPFTTIPMIALGNNLYRATLPGGSCGQTAQYYFTARTSADVLVPAPSSAPATTFTATVAAARVMLSDDFESDQGWIVKLNAITGNFERAAPQQTQQCGRDVQPAADHTPGGCSMCYVTGSLAGGDINANDLDGGPTRVTSPEVALSAFTAAEVQAYIWFYNGYIPDDQVTVDVSSDGGTSNWTTAAVIPNGRSAWQLVKFRIDAVTPLTDHVRIRVATSDTGVDSTMEVAIDDVTITAWGCNAPPACIKGDLNGDGLADGADIAQFVTDLGLACPGTITPAERCAGDFDNDGGITSADAPAFVNCLLNPGTCP